MRKLVLAMVLLAIGSSMALMAQQPKSASAPKVERKILVTYFTFPERDGVDGSTGASRIVVSDKMYGTTEYVAKVIAEKTGADLFQIKTTHTYLNRTHKELIDYAKKEADTKSYPKMTSSQSVQTIEKLETGAKVISIPAISNRNAAASRVGLHKWLQEKGFTNKQQKR